VRVVLALALVACNGNAPAPPAPPPPRDARPTAPTGLVRGSIAIDGGRACAIEATRRVACWGRTGDRFDATPVEVPDLDDVVGLAAGPSMTCAWTSHGRVRCWGGERFSPHLDDIVQVSVGIDSACGLHATGRVSCWTNGKPLLEVAGLTDAVEIAGAFSFGAEQLCARTKSGEVICGNQVSALKPIPELAGATSLAGAGARFAVLLPDHRLASWVGWTGRPMPTFISGVAGERVIVAGHLSADAELCVLGTHSHCAAWANEPSLAISAPRPLPDGVRDLATDLEATCMRIADRVTCSGRVGRLGDGAPEYPRDFVAVRGIADARQLAAVGRTMCVLRGNGHVACWGERVGGGAIDREPVELPDVTDATEIAMQGDDRGDGAIGIAVAVCARRAHGATCWTNQDGRLQATDPPELAPATKLYAGAAICGVSSAGTVGCVRFGENRGYIPGFSPSDYETFVYRGSASARGRRIAHALEGRLQRALRSHRLSPGFRDPEASGSPGRTTPAFQPPAEARTDVVEVRWIEWLREGDYNDVRGALCERRADGTVACWGERDYLGAGHHSTRDDQVSVAGFATTGRAD